MAAESQLVVGSHAEVTYEPTHAGEPPAEEGNPRTASWQAKYNTPGRKLDHPDMDDFIIAEAEKFQKLEPAGGIHATLAQRGANYGAFSSHAEIAQRLKEDMRATPSWDKMAPDQKECLEMFAHKAARLLNGNPDWLDGWRDLIGYTQLVYDRMLTTDGVTDARIVKQRVINGKMVDHD